MGQLIEYVFAEEYTSKLLFSLFIGVYTAYYYIAARTPPKIYGKSADLISFFRSYLPFLEQPYSPYFFGFTGRIQTLLRPLIHRTRKIEYEQDCLVLHDGGEMTISWSNPKGLSDDAPVMILLPGLTGCGCCHYITSLAKQANACGYRSVVVNNRGTCSHKLKTPVLYSAAHTSDIAAALIHIKGKYPNAPLAAVGISLGALILFNYLAQLGKKAKSAVENGEEEVKCPLQAAMCVCMPWDLTQTAEKLEKSLDWFLFNMPLAYNLRGIVNRNAKVLSEKYDVPRILKSRSVKEFDECLTVSMFGYESVDDYYNRASPVFKIADIPIPVLCLNAADDPFVPFKSLPLDAVSQSSKLVMALTRHGGHIGFLDGWIPTGPNFLDRSVKQFVSAIFEHFDEYQKAAVSTNEHQ